MKNVLLCLAVLSLFLDLQGCKKEDPHPELQDPVFQDLEKRASDAQKSYDDELKNQVDIEKKIETAEPNTIEKKNAEGDLVKSKAASLDHEQMAHYFKIRAERRKLVDHVTYTEALAKGSQWPDPHEYSDYQVNIRLQEASRDWSKHVPKLQDRIESVHKTEQAKQEKPKE